MYSCKSNEVTAESQDSRNGQKTGYHITSSLGGNKSVFVTSEVTLRARWVLL